MVAAVTSGHKVGFLFGLFVDEGDLVCLFVCFCTCAHDHMGFHPHGTCGGQRLVTSLPLSLSTLVSERVSLAEP